MLEQAGCTRHIRIARSGQEALDYLQACGSTGTDEYPRPDLILLDINMPAMDGWEFLDRYRLLPAATTRDIVLIMLTTSLNPDDEFRARSRPEVAGFENKPLGQAGLDRVLKAFSGHRGTGHLP